jgi:uncharacterized protein (TIGR02058 family)
MVMVVRTAARAIGLCSIRIRAASSLASSKSWSAEWKEAGLGAKMASQTEELNRLLFVQCGIGCDQHGDRTTGSTVAALRAVRDAISFNSIPGMKFAVPGGRKNMLIHCKLGVPAEYPQVDLDDVAKAFPYGKLLPIEVVSGGLTFGCGRIVPELGDTDDTAIVAVAVISIGYHDPEVKDTGVPLSDGSGDREAA